MHIFQPIVNYLLDLNLYSPTEPTEVLKTTEVTAPAEETIGAEIGKATSAASLQVINDLLDGKELKDSVLDRYDFYCIYRYEMIF